MKTQPTRRKGPELPRINSAPAKPRVMFLDYDGSVHPDPVAKSIPCAVIPCNLENRKLARREAREMVKASKFFQLPEEEQVEAIAQAISLSVTGKEFSVGSPTIKEICTRDSAAVLARIQKGAKP